MNPTDIDQIHEILFRLGLATHVDTLLNGTGGLGSFIRLFDGQGQQLAFNSLITMQSSR